MVRWPAGCFGIDTTKPQITKIKLVDESFDHSDGIVLVNPIIKAFWEQGGLAAIRAFNKAPHPIPRKSPKNHIMNSVFTQPGSFASFSSRPCSVRSAPDRRPPAQPVQASRRLLTGTPSASSTEPLPTPPARAPHSHTFREFLAAPNLPDGCRPPKRVARPWVALA